MDDINILEELGLQEVSRKTHIETKFLEYMVTKQFSKLNRINTLGFVKILKREYNLDLSSWVEEFESFKSEHDQDVNSSNHSPVFAQEDKEKPSKRWIVWLILLALIGAAFWKFDGMGYVNTLKEKYIDNNITKVDETPTKSIKAEDTTQDITSNIQANEDTQDTQEVESVEQEESNNDNQNVFVAENVKNDEEILEENISKNDENISENSVQNVDEQEADKEEFESALLKPKRRIWVGIVDLQKRKKSQFATKNSIDINLTKPQIIVTGHGDFILRDENGEEKSYSSKNKKYYYVDGGTITQIDKKEFISYNGGKSW